MDEIRFARFTKDWLKLSLLVGFATLANPINQWVAQATPRGGTLDAPGLILMFLAHGLAIAWWINHTAERGFRLGARVAGVYLLISCVLAQIETWMFLSVWNQKMSGSQVAVIALQAAVFSVMIGLLVWIAYRTPVPKTKAKEMEAVSLYQGRALLKRVAILALLYFPIYWLAGYFIAIPLSGPAFREVCGDLQVPAWLALFQFVRGLGWGLAAWLVLQSMSGKRWRVQFGNSLVLTVVMDAGLLVKNPLFPDPMRWAHFVEIFASMMLFGWLCAILLMKNNEGTRKV